MVARGQDDERFGRYVLVERLGIGGMATVHRAKTRGVDGFEAEVAVKRILPHLAEDESFVASFVREAKLAALLNHPNIARINELGRIDGAYFMAMEYIAGHTLLEVLRWERVIGPPPNEVVLSLLIQLCDALEYAHALVDGRGTPVGIVHRDLSPSNLIVEHSGYLKVIDFGIAKATRGELGTASGLAKGKQGYMSPEALRARGVDHRSDIYSTGVVAHELLTGRRLFKVKDDYETLARVMRAQVAAPSHWNPRCPDELDAIVLRALARDPDERWQSAGAMRDALEAFALGQGLRPTHRAVGAWLSQAREAQSVLVRGEAVDEPEPPSIVVVTPTADTAARRVAGEPPRQPATTAPEPDVDPEQAPDPSARPAAPAPMSYVAFETASGRRVTMLEGPEAVGADLRSLLRSRTPLPRPPVQWPAPGRDVSAAPLPAWHAAPRTSWRRRDTLPPEVPARASRRSSEGVEYASSVGNVSNVALVVIGCALIALAFYLSW